jgi:hypothetical protein
MSFPITCTACHKTFTISDEIYEKKVAGRVVTIKCKSCSQGIRVDGTKGTSAEAPAAPEPAAAPAPEPAAAPAGEPLWAVDYPDGQDREFTTAEVIAELERGAVIGSTLVWRDGMAEWLEVHQVPELAGELSKIEAKKKAAAIAAAKAAAAAPVHKPRAPMPTVTGLAGLPGAGVAIKPRPGAAPTPAAELPKPRAQQPSAPAVATPLPKPRAQAPSGSDDATPVPFPKARAQQPSTPELPKPRAQQPSAPVLPLPKPVAAPPPAPPPLAPPAPPPPIAPAAVTPPLPFAAPAPAAPSPFAAPPAPLPPPEPMFDATPPLPASVAKVVSRPPQVQPAFPVNPVPTFHTAPALVADHATVEWPEAKKKTPLIIVGVLVAVAAVVGAMVLLGGKDEVPPSAPISALPPSPAATPTPSPTSTPSPAAPQSAAETATGSDPVATAPDPGATPGAGFAELFAAGARKAESKGATVAPTARFDAAATRAPLAQAATDAQACKQSGGPTGKVTVVVTFDPNGKVSGATITDPPFAGTATATCISSALKRATIAPFSGLPGTVSKTFSIL